MAGASDKFPAPALLFFTNKTGAVKMVFTKMIGHVKAGIGLCRLRDLKNPEPEPVKKALIRTQSLIFCPVSDDFS